MNDQIQKLDTLPWYKQGWPWALISIPLLTIVACSITIYIAFDSNDSLVRDNYYKEGLAINTSIERTERAKKLSIIANISIDTTSKLVTVKLSANESLPSNLLLKFSHPTLHTKDREFDLTSLTEGEFVAGIETLEEAYWHISLEDDLKNWLIKTRWLYPTKTSIIVDASKT